MGTTKRVPTGAFTTVESLRPLLGINADGASSQNCRLIDAKWNGGGQYRTSKKPPPWLQAKDTYDTNSTLGELLRYRTAVFSNAQLHALEIRTNTSEAESYFNSLLPQFGFIIVDVFVVNYP